MSTNDPADHDAPSPATDEAAEEAARQEARRAVDAAIMRMARAAGAEICERPVWPGAASTLAYAEPGAGMHYARMVADAAHHAEHSYIGHAREHGMTWQQIGQALNLGGRAQQRGAPLAEVAFEHATGAEHVRPFETLVFTWRCQSCGQYISDHGPYNTHPDDNERGHADGCERHTAAIAAHEAEWADED
jgi:hypothetical protein